MSQLKQLLPSTWFTLNWMQQDSYTHSKRTAFLNAMQLNDYVHIDLGVPPGEKDIRYPERVEH